MYIKVHESYLIGFVSNTLVLVAKVACDKQN